jgi:hypothetical protein
MRLSRVFPWLIKWMKLINSGMCECVCVGNKALCQNLGEEKAFKVINSRENGVMQVWRRAGNTG